MLPMLSRLAATLPGVTNPLYTLRDELISRGVQISDLVSGNVNEHGILFPQDILDDILSQASRSCRVYHPDSLGQEAARCAISAYYGTQGVSIPESRILLTPGTSTSYLYCFKLLADAGDEILCPQPSYPLFDYIAALCGVRMISYRLREEAGWEIDLDHLEASISTQTRAIVLISPHNPTGHVSSREELAGLAEIAGRHGLAIVSDEVFNEFLHHDITFPRPNDTGAPLVFMLNGFSKMLALPGMKLGWIAISGEAEVVGKTLKALELISDTFLPVNEIVQASVPGLLTQSSDFRASYAAEIRFRWKLTEELLRDCRACEFVRPGGGFYVTLKLAAGIDEETVAESILRDCHFLVHPGHLYDAEPSHLVFTFIQRPEFIRTNYPRLLASLQR